MRTEAVGVEASQQNPVDHGLWKRPGHLELREACVFQILQHLGPLIKLKRNSAFLFSGPLGQLPFNSQTARAHMSFHPDFQGWSKYWAWNWTPRLPHLWTEINGKDSVDPVLPGSRSHSMLSYLMEMCLSTGFSKQPTWALCPE